MDNGLFVFIFVYILFVVFSFSCVFIENYINTPRIVTTNTRNDITSSIA